MCSSGTVRRSWMCIALWALLSACGGSSGSSATPPPAGSAGTPDARLQLVIDFDHKRFELIQENVPLWSLPFHNPDSSEVNDWIESFGKSSGEVSAPLAENVLLRSKNLLTDSVIAIVADASGFDAHLLQRKIPGRFILRWADAALDIETPVSASGGGFNEYFQDARITARRIFGEEQMTVYVDSMGAVTLQRVAVPPIVTRIRPPRKH